MKKFLFTLTAILILGTLYAQPLKKGNLIGTHVVTYELLPGVTFEQFEKFYLEEFIPEYEKIRTGWELTLLKGRRGIHKDKLLVVIKMESEKVRAKYFNKDGSTTDFYKETGEKVKPLYTKLKTYITYTTEYTNWEVL
ncbi:hypothetical protein N9164_03955 [Draconibacterium sp.]|nr:hypothetical protein [Draconibacterium sp.]